MLSTIKKLERWLFETAVLSEKVVSNASYKNYNCLNKGKLFKTEISSHQLLVLL